MSATTRRVRRRRLWWKAKAGATQHRLTLITVAFLAVGLVLALGCLYIQGIDPVGNAAVALKATSTPITAPRGAIYDRNGQVLAESESAVNITTDPTQVASNGVDPTRMSLTQKLRAQAGAGIIAGTLSAYVGGDFDSYYAKLSTTKTSSGTTIRYAVLATTVLDYINQQIADRLSTFGYVGLHREQAPIRVYPQSTVAANVVGYMMHDDTLASQGQYPWVGGGGLESSLNVSLSGVNGLEMYQSSPYGLIPQATDVVQQAQPGVSYTLTIDSGLQYMQDQRLAAGVQAARAQSGVAVTMNVKTGQILALSNYPTFDPNNLSTAASGDLRNPAVENAYEPGSVEKVLTMAALADQGLVTPDTRVIIPGSVTSGGQSVSDSWAHGTLHLTAAGVIAQSSNIGMILLARQMDKATLSTYLTSFGLGSRTNLGLPGENGGRVPATTMTDQTRDQIAFGQGLSVTAVQEAAAVAAVVNHGVYNSPTIIASATTASGKSVPVPATTSRQVISPTASDEVRQMMEAMVQSHGKQFAIPGYRTGDKSGTAQAIDPACGCYRGNVVSFVGVAPIEDPQILTYVVIDHPAGSTSGSAAAAPVYKDVMTVALQRYGVSLSTDPAPTYQTSW